MKFSDYYDYYYYSNYLLRPRVIENLCQQKGQKSLINDEQFDVKIYNLGFKEKKCWICGLNILKTRRKGGVVHCIVFSSHFALKNS